MSPLLAAVLAASLFQAKPPDQKRIDEAIAKGIAFLKSAESPSLAGTLLRTGNSDELVLWTFVHAGVPESNPKFQELFSRMLEARLERTYPVCLQAMILEEVNRVKYQDRIAQCAQFLVDNQCQNGQWSYGEPSDGVKELPKKDVATSDRESPSDGKKPKIQRRIEIRRTKDGPPRGDNSNAQYAALALRDCFDAGVRVPEQTIRRAATWWRTSQRLPKADAKGGVAGTEQRAGGWGYDSGTPDDVAGLPYAAMTAGAVGSLAIFDHMTGRSWQRDPSVRAGVAWLGSNFSVAENRQVGSYAGYDNLWMSYYFLYALERAAILLNAAAFDGKSWYTEGARFILENQQPDGSWTVRSKGSPPDQPVWDTCFAILFLKRATRPLEPVASVDRYVIKEEEK